MGKSYHLDVSDAVCVTSVLLYLDPTSDGQVIPSWTGVEINARPLARGEWKSRGMSRICAQVVRRASGYLNLFCQLYVPTNESNY